MRILLVDDDRELHKTITTVLNKTGFKYDQAFSSREAQYFLATQSYDCLILDINLPDGTGYGICQQVRSNRNLTPVLFLSVNAEVQDKIKGLQIGADDYLTKPFSTDELIARIHSLIRRFSTTPPTQYQVSNFIFDPTIHTVTIDGQRIHLTKTESFILSALFRSKNTPVSREVLWEKLYGDEFSLTNSLDVIIFKLRQKIKNQSQVSIESTRGVGYQLKVKQADDKPIN